MAIAQFVSNRRTCCLLLTGYKLLSPYDVHVFQPCSVSCTVLIVILNYNA